jgi:hypothetical protein
MKRLPVLLAIIAGIAIVVFAAKFAGRSNAGP